VVVVVVLVVDYLFAFACEIVNLFLSLFFFFFFKNSKTTTDSQNKPISTTILEYNHMISNFFVLSPRGDTILAKQYRVTATGMGAHERSHTEAFFRKIKFWNDEQDHASTVGTIRTSSSSNATTSMTTTTNGGDLSTDAATETQQQQHNNNPKKTGDAPPVFLMPDGWTYFHVKRNGLIFGASSARNVSPNTVLEVSETSLAFLTLFLSLSLSNDRFCSFCLFVCLALVHDRTYIQGLLRNVIGRSIAKELYFVL
jgi:hypothetical protein